MISASARASALSVGIHVLTFAALWLGRPAATETTTLEGATAFTWISGEANQPGRAETPNVTLNLPPRATSKAIATVATEPRSSPLNSAPRSDNLARPHLTFDQYREQYGAPPSARGERPAESIRSGVRIDPARFAFPSDASPSAGPTQESEDAEARFIAQLVERLRHAYAAQADAPVGLATTIEFTLFADGSLQNIRLLNPSADIAYNAGVLQAVQLAQVANFPRSAIGKVYRVKFQVSERP